MGSVADIPFNRHLDIGYDEETGHLHLPDAPAMRNHFGTVSFCAQFALAEAASAQYLFDRLGMNLSTDLPTLRNASIRFTRPTTGESSCELLSMQHTPEEFRSTLDTKGKILTTVTVAVIAENGVKALEGAFIWLILRAKNRAGK